MTLRHMKIYAAVCELESVTKAAEKLYISQPSVSQAIIELETRFGTKLFDRISRRLYITDAGKQLYEYISHILALYDEMEDKMRNWEHAGSLHVGSSITIGNRIIPALVEKFGQLRPDVRIYITIDNSDTIEQKVLNGELDFALIEGVIHNSQIIRKKFMDDKLVLVCGDSHPLRDTGAISVRDIGNYDFFSREKGSGTREIVDSNMLIHNVYLQPVWESISTQAIINAVKKGLGISILPYRLVEPDIRKGTIKEVRIKEMSFDRPFYMIHYRNKYLGPAAKDFMELVVEAGQDPE